MVLSKSEFQKNGKLNCIKHDVNLCIYEVLIFVGTWLTPVYFDEELGFTNFNIYRCGVLIAVRKDVNSRVIAQSVTLNKFF